MSDVQFRDSIFTFINTTMVLFTLNKSLNGRWKQNIVSIFFACIYVPFYNLLTYSSERAISPGENSMRQFLRILIMLGMFFIFVCIHKAAFKRKLQVYAVTMIAIFVSETIMTVIFSAAGINSLTQFTNVPKHITLRCINTILYIGACIAAYILLRAQKHNSYVSVLCIALLFCCCMMCSLVTAYNLRSGWDASLIILITAGIALLCIFGIYKLFTQLEEKERLKQQFYWLKQLQKTEAQYINELQDKSRELSKIRHDFDEHLLSIGLLIKQNTPEALEEAEQIITNVGRSLASVKVCQYTVNLLVNTVLDTKVNEAQQAGVTVCPSVNLPPKIDRIEAADLNSLLINLLNNAITACADLPDDADKTVHIKTAIKNNFLIIKTTNPFKEVFNDNQGKLLTTKTNKSEHGLGLQIIEDIVKKYNGASKIELQEEQFIHTVFLNLQQNPKNK